jgi:energy-coupling factor transport system ATP-binding protein
MLDPQGRREVVDIMERLNKDEGITVLNITHYMEEAARADRVIVINDGKIALDGTPREVFSQVEKLLSMGLEAPQGNELILELKKAGLNISGDSLTEEECVQTLYRFLS